MGFIDGTNLRAVWKRVAEYVKVLTGDVNVAVDGTLQEQINRNKTKIEAIGSTVLYSGSKSTDKDDYVKLSDRWDKYSIIYVKCILTGDGNASVSNDVWVAIPVCKSITYNSSYIPIHAGVWDDGSGSVYLDLISGSVELIDGYYENLYIRPSTAEEIQFPTEEGCTISKSSITSNITVTTVIGIK